MKRFASKYEFGEIIFTEDEDGGWVDYRDVERCEEQCKTLEYLLIHNPILLTDTIATAQSAEEFWVLIMMHAQP